MRIIGFHPLDDQQAAAVDKVIPAINDAVVASSVTFSIAGIGALDLAPSNLEDVMTGADESGTPNCSAPSSCGRYGRTLPTHIAAIAVNQAIPFVMPESISAMVKS